MPSSPDYSFQDRAVECIATDFVENSCLKSLLVIPTGGGKTRTAVKAILRLHEDGFFSEEGDRILWVAHRQELLGQAKEAFEAEGAHKLSDEALGRTIFQSNVPASQEVLKNDNIKLVVIDEAHHSAASTYLPLFRPNVGVLGLTATPSRHDGAPLEFEKESYSIGFPDLVKFGVVLRPEVIELQGVSSDIEDFSEKELEKLNSKARNEIIRDALIAKKDVLEKIIVYVGSKQHAKDLCALLKDSALGEAYESISYVLGGDGNNSRNQVRAAFFEEEKSYGRSIIVNVQVLTEGYDDPSVNAVVMAAPFKSKLTYMQCMGRAIRRDPGNEFKKSFVVELVEELPNIRYRIDNRWIYSEISDLLEPTIVDLHYSGIVGLNAELLGIYEAENVEESRRRYLGKGKVDRPQLLLFKCLTPAGEICHEPILMNGENRRRIQNWFNFLSTKIKLGRLRNVNRSQALEMVRKWWGSELEELRVRSNIYDAMLNSLDSDNIHSSWVKLVTFTEIPEKTCDELEIFLEDAVNKNEILEEIGKGDLPAEAVVFKFPLPLSGSFARVTSIENAGQLESVISKLGSLDKPIEQQVFHSHKILETSDLSLEPFLVHSLPRIVREGKPYRFNLK